MSSDALSTVTMPAFSPGAAHAAAPMQKTASSVQPPVRKPPAAIPDVEAVKAAAQQIESYLKSIGRELSFHVDDNSGQVVVSVLDSETGDLIRQIPDEVVLRMARVLKEEEPSLVNLTA